MTIKRDITTETEKYLETDEMLIFVGARQAGKTTILKQIQGELEVSGSLCYFLNLDDPQYLSLLDDHPRNLLKIFSLNLEVRNFIFVDEIQYLKDPSNFLKYIFDEYGGKIKLIVSGSSAFYIDKKFKDSLAGRKKIFHVNTLSFAEFLRFKGEVDLSHKDFDKVGLDEANKLDLLYREFMLFGGYPRVVLAPLEEKENILKELAYSYIKKDIYEANIKQEEVFYALFKILAGQVGNLVNASELANTLNVSKSSIDNYLYTMKKSYHIALVSPFFRNARKELSKMPKVFFCDTGLRNFFVGNMTPFELRSDKGQLLENAVFRQLTERYGLEGIRFWRTTARKEVDFIVQDKFAFEVKTSVGQFKNSKYDAFRRAYPEIKFSVVSIGATEKVLGDVTVIDPWQV